MLRISSSTFHKSQAGTLGIPILVSELTGRRVSRVVHASDETGSSPTLDSLSPAL